MWRLVCALLTGRIGYAGVKERSAVLARAIDLASAAGRARSRLSAEG
jgi:hypothetical protein